MKIGILTFWWSNNNYGQLLQCYALQKYLRDLGCEPFLIRYNYNSDLRRHFGIKRFFKLFNPYLVIRFILHKIDKQKKANIREPEREFEQFRQRFLCQSDKMYENFEDLNINPPHADAYIVGSDQVWNYNYIDALHSVPYRAYFLDFGKENVKRFAYAASWGVTELPIKIKNTLKPLLARFDYIGVREQSGKKLCSQCGRYDAEWVCDPTLLLTAGCYRKLYNESTIRKPEKKFILLYMLNNIFDFDIQNVYDYAAKKNLEVVYVTGNGVVDNRSKFFATIPEWLWLVDNADYVITNSFHCSVFSTIFHKQFGVVPLCGKQLGMNARFESLFELRGTGNRFILNYDFSVLDKEFVVKDVAVSNCFLRLMSE